MIVSLWDFLKKSGVKFIKRVWSLGRKLNEKLCDWGENQTHIANIWVRDLISKKVDLITLKGKTSSEKKTRTRSKELPGKKNEAQKK